MNLAFELKMVVYATYEVVVLVFLMHLILPRVKILLTLNTHTSIWHRMNKKLLADARASFILY